MKRILQDAGIFALVAFGSLCLIVAYEVLEIAPKVQAIVSDAAAAMDNLVVASGNVRDVSAQLADEKAGAVATLRGIPPMVTAAAKQEIRHATDSLAPIVKDAVDLAGQKVDATLQRADAVIDLGKNVRADLKPSLDHAASITAQVDDAAPLFLDCEYNPDCVFNRFQGTSKAIEQMAQAGAKAAPEVSASIAGVSKSADGIAADAKREADMITRPKKWYEKMLGPVYTVARIVALIF